MLKALILTLSYIRDLSSFVTYHKGTDRYTISFPIYNNSRPDDKYSVKDSAVEVSDNATMQVGK